MSERTRRITFERDLEGTFIAWADDEPVILRIDDSSRSYLACFSSQEALKSFMGRVQNEPDEDRPPFNSIREIKNTRMFLQSLRYWPDVTLILDPWTTPDGTLFFQQLNLHPYDGMN